jgi:3-isopropylmalate dehydrogenase
MSKKLLLLPGDGIGPEVTAQSRLLIEHLNSAENLNVVIEEALFGGASIDAYGLPLTDETKAQALSSDAVLMGAVGGPKWAGQSYDKRPEAGLLALRSAMDVYANLRPAICFDALADASSLKREFVEGLNLLFVRELTGGVYFGNPRGIEDLGNGQRRGVNTHVYTSGEIRRVAHTAFRLAQTRSGRVCSAEKSNVMEAGLLWKEEVQKLRDDHYPGITLDHMLADNMAMQLVKAPKQFDVIVTDNLFGDILADEAAMLTGSLGMMPSAALGDEGQPGLYEPIHGSAPDIAGRGIANPCASILSLAMAMRYSLDRPDLADRIEAAVSSALNDGIRSGDIGGKATTPQMGAAIIARV